MFTSLLAFFSFRFFCLYKHWKTEPCKPHTKLHLLPIYTQGLICTQMRDILLNFMPTWCVFEWSDLTQKYFDKYPCGFLICISFRNRYIATDGKVYINIVKLKFFFAFFLDVRWWIDSKYFDDNRFSSRRFCTWETSSKSEIRSGIFLY